MKGPKGSQGTKQQGAETCRFCQDPKLPIEAIQVELLRAFITDAGRIVPRRVSGNCFTHQQAVATAIKQSRMLELLPPTTIQGQLPEE